MLPNYKPYLNAVALKMVSVKVDVPAVSLGLAETMESVDGAQFETTSNLNIGRTIDGSTIPAGSYFGLPGYGSMIPVIEPDEGQPYFGDPIGSGTG